jgi:hypothetical protein
MFYGFGRVCSFFAEKAWRAKAAQPMQKTSKKRGIYPFFIEQQNIYIFINKILNEINNLANFNPPFPVL